MIYLFQRKKTTKKTSKDKISKNFFIFCKIKAKKKIALKNSFHKQA